MKRTLLRASTILLTLMMILPLCLATGAQTATTTDDEITILFTNDLHSHLLPCVSAAWR